MILLLLWNYAKIIFAFVLNLNAELWGIKVELLCLLINQVSLDFKKIL